MSVIGNALLLGGGDAAFTTDRSVRLRSSASASFSKSYSTGLNSQKVVFSTWVKRGTLGVARDLLGVDSGTAWYSSFLQFTAADQLRCWTYYGAVGTRYGWTTTRVFRDPSAWMHIHLIVDTSISGQQSRRLFINGIEELSFTAEASGYNSVGMNHYIFATGAHSIFASMDGYAAETYGICGQTLFPSAFGEYDAVRNTQWKPKTYTGTYNTNDFYLKFADNSNNTAATIGKDSSGNGNNWTPTGISVTAGVTYDSMTDVPTLTSETASNFPVLNPLSGLNIGSGNLQVTGSGAGDPHISTIAIPETGKWYCEMSSTAYNASTIVGWFGVSNRTGGNFSGLLSRVTGAGAGFFQNDTLISSVNIGALNDVFGIAVDRGANTIQIYINNTLQATVPTLVTGVDLFFYYGSYTSGTGWVNFGQRPFANTTAWTTLSAAGFKALNTYNLPDPAIPSSDDYHKVYTYTGNGGGLQVGEIQKPASLFNLDRSLRFRKSNSAYLSRTQTTTTNSVKCTFSGWVKRGELGTLQVVFGGYTGTDADTQLYFDTTNQLKFTSRITNVNGAAFEWVGESAAVFRDPQLWMHIVVKVDTSTLQATNNDYYTVYVNGVAQTFTTSSGATLVTVATVQNRNTCWNVSGYSATVGRQRVNYFDGYLADVYFIDGQALTPTDFGQYDGNYYWTPKAYSGTYGTNGWHLEFEDFSAATAAAIGKDTSGQGNNWTPNNISVTAGTTYDSMTDVPTQTSTGTANFATFSPLNNATTLSNGSLTSSAATNTGVCATLDIPSAGSFYWEVTATTVVAGGNTLVGMIAINQATTVRDGTVAGVRLVARSDGLIIIDSTTVQSGLGAWASGDVIGCAYNATTNSFQFYKNNATFGTAVTPTSSYTFVPWCCSVVSGTSVFNINFGQRPFAYTPPTGFKSLNSFNVAEVLGDVESPDFVWIKSRSAGTHHALFNSVTGVGKYLQSSNAVVEVNDVNSLIQFNKNGFLLGNAAIVNTLSSTYVAAAWKVAATTVTNTNGTISSQVRSNSTNGISIVTWTGNNTNNSTIGHGFTSLTPKVIFAKRRDTTGSNWIAMHSALATDNNLFLSGTGLTQAISAISGGGISTTVTPTTFTVKQGTTDQSNVNASGTTYVAYCFAEIAGFSKFTSYAANASSTDGPFVACGFAPRWIMIKRATGASGTGGWIMYDTSRSTYNTMSEYLFAEGAAGFGTLAAIDVTANGFKIRSNNVHLNQTAGDVYIVMAFAEHPFKYALAR